jgi:hypothetical protein
MKFQTGRWAILLPSHQRVRTIVHMTTTQDNATQIDDLLAQLAQKPPRVEQMAIRRRLRALGHWGGLRTAGHETQTTPPEPAAEDVQIWKVAPGEQAAQWDECRENSFIAIGWHEVGDYNQYKTREELQKALVDTYEKDGGIRSIWPFVHEMRVGDIVIASRGLSEVVGIGKIMGEYLPFGHPENPSTHDGLVNSRLVNWLITKPVEFDEQMFVRPTLQRLRDEQWDEIKSAYLSTYPNDPSISAVFQILDGKPIIARPARNATLSPLEQLTSRTRNILLYGPPGTGKTFAVNKFACAFLSSQIDTPESRRQARSQLLRELRWHDAVAIAMYLGASPHYTVPEMLNLDVLKEYAATTRNKSAANQVWNSLQVHTDPSSPRVAYKNRIEPFLFDKSNEKSGRQSVWRLTPEGKEYVAEEYAEQLKALSGNTPQAGAADSFLRFVTFHQSFAYEEFVEGLKPLPEESDGAIRYGVVPGIFKQTCIDAQRAWESNKQNPPKFLLIIDEINRANIAKVFGELITLIEDDKRLGQPNALSVTLPYSQSKFAVPPNLYILGTLNTADRSIAQLDLALRRRFTFLELMPDYSLPELNHTIETIHLPTLLQKLNFRISQLLDRDHQIGHAYLLNLKTPEDLHFAFAHKILPLLQEYFYNDNDRLRPLLGDAFFEKTPTDPTLKEILDTESRYTLKPLTPQSLLTALQQI